MLLLPIPLDKLIVNPSNDRHGKLENETAAIRWLMTSREQHMRNLAADIVAQGKIYEPPLVTLNGDHYIVHDGNRRVTCLKLLTEPLSAPTGELRDLFESLRKRWKGRFPVEIECQLETNLPEVDEILFRRHTGAQRGVGQTQWDDAAKHNFILRTDQKAGPNIAEGIEKKLLAGGYIASEGDIPRSNLNRLLSSEKLRNMAGISLIAGKLHFSADPEKALSALDHITSDLVSKRLVLGHIWNNEGKLQYLDELKTRGVLPGPDDELRVAVPFDGITPRKKKSAPRTPQSAATRATLIPTDIVFPVTWSARTVRPQAIWLELQSLPIQRFPNSVAVSFRVLLELAVDHYLTARKSSVVAENDRFSKKLSWAAADLADRGTISEKYKKEIQKFANDEALISMSTMHRYVHSLTLSPSPDHLRAIWDSLAEFLIPCLNESSGVQKAA